VLTPPTNLDDRRQNRPSGRRSRQSAAGPAAEPTVPAREPVNGQDGRPAVRRSASRLTVPVEDVEAFAGDQPPGTAPRMEQLLERQSSPAAAVAEDAASLPDEGDAWFDAQATTIPQSNSTPAGLGSAALGPNAAVHRQTPVSRARAKQHRSSSRKDVRSPGRAVMTVAAIAVLGLLTLTVAVGLPTSAPRPTRAAARVLPSAISPTSFDAYSAKTRPRPSLSSRTPVSRHRRSAHARPPSRRHTHRHSRTSSTITHPAVTRIAPVVRSAPAATTTTSTTARTPVYTPTPRATTTPSASVPSPQPAYGPNGTLGPGSSPNG